MTQKEVNNSAISKDGKSHDQNPNDKSHVSKASTNLDKSAKSEKREGDEEDEYDGEYDEEEAEEDQDP